MTIKNGTIFVQIASYRDPELRKTLEDILDKADNPDRLKICVAWQHTSEDEWDTLDEYLNDDRFIIIDIPHTETNGTCWARNTIQQKYNGEDYTLQLDSHHRFVKGWDSECIRMIKQLQKKGHHKPLLTGYIPSYDPANDPDGRVQAPWKMDFDRFTPEGVIFFLPATIDDWKERTEPVPARFFSAHFTFTLGIFCKEVQHDPKYYFHGEEIALAVRSFTFGYDLFHPHKIIAWHEYTRKGRTKHWDDDDTWVEKNKTTFYRLKGLLGTDGTVCTPCMKKQLVPYHLGEERTIADYEKYAGIRFKDRGVQQYTLDKVGYPPNPIVEDYDNSFHKVFKHCIDIHINDVPEKDYDFWAVAFHDKDGKDIHRQDASKEEVANLIATQKDGWINLWRTYTGALPSSWSVWPYSVSKEWCKRLSGNLGIEKNG
jgi:hypothetical protein